MIFVNEDTVDKLFEYFTAKKFPKDTLASFFISALISGADESVKLVDAAFELLGDYTYEIMCENFFYPYSYPIGLIKYLMQNGLDAKQTAGILKENSLLFLFFRINENNSILHGHNQTYIDEVLKKYSE